MRGHQHLFRGNTTAQRASAAKTRIFFNHRGLKAELASPDGGHIAPGSTADDGHVKLFVSQGL
jgi:hypothetical protein